MKLAILAVEKKELSIRKAAVVFGVPKDSLNRRVKGKLKSLSKNERHKNVLVVDGGWWTLLFYGTRAHAMQFIWKFACRRNNQHKVLHS